MRFTTTFRRAIRSLRLSTQDRKAVFRENVVVRSPNRLVVGDGTQFDAGCFVHCGGMQWCAHVDENVVIGKDCYFGPNSVLFGAGGLDIGDNVLVGPNAVLTSFAHEFHRHDIAIADHPHVFGKITIADNVWIGANASILPGITIHSGAVIGAGAVVTKNVPANTVFAGVPATKLRSR